MKDPGQIPRKENNGDKKKPIKYKSKVSSQRRESQNPAGNTAQIRKLRREELNDQPQVI